MTASSKTFMSNDKTWGATHFFRLCLSQDQQQQLLPIPNDRKVGQHDEAKQINPTPDKLSKFILAFFHVAQVLLKSSSAFMLYFSQSTWSVAI